MNGRALFLVVLLLGVGLAGCVDAGDGEDAGEEVSRNRADLGQGTGAVRGVITDSAVQPVPGANVTVLETNTTVSTRADGGFRIDGLAPGEYQVRAGAGGFLPQVQTVTVQPDELSTLDFILPHLNEELPFKQEFEVAGFMEYSWGLGWNLTDAAPGGQFFVRDTNCDYDQIAGPLCRGEFELEAPLETLVFEQAWDAQSPLAESMYTMMRVSDNASIIDGTWEIFSYEGPSPMHVRMDREDLDAVTRNFTERCENGEDQFCGLNFRDNGWPLQTRVWASWHCPTQQAGFCAMVEQDYRQFLTAFYHAPAPVGYQLLEG